MIARKPNEQIAGYGKGRPSDQGSRAQRGEDAPDRSRRQQRERQQRRLVTYPDVGLPGDDPAEKIRRKKGRKPGKSSRELTRKCSRGRADAAGTLWKPDQQPSGHDARPVSPH